MHLLRQPDGSITIDAAQAGQSFNDRSVGRQSAVHELCQESEAFPTLTSCVLSRGFLADARLFLGGAV